MTHLTSPAIVLRRRDYGDFDLILTVLTKDHGICALIAKAAKKSTKRFQGILEPFATLRIVYRQARGKGMQVLEEATLESPFNKGRADLFKMAYASYWCELVALWLQEGEDRPDVFDLLAYALNALNHDLAPVQLLNVLFQMRFVGQEGLRPVLERCSCCQIEIEKLSQHQFCIDLRQGGIVCHQCPAPGAGQLRLSKGTLKQLLWMAQGDLTMAQRVRFSPSALAEATQFLEAFVPYHIGRAPKSLAFLHQIRGQM